MSRLTRNAADRDTRTRQILDLYTKGLANKQIAKQLGFSSNYVWSVLKREGIQFSGHGHARVVLSDNGRLICRKCQIEKPATEEHFRRYRGYLVGTCRVCQRVHQASWRNKNIFAYRVQGIRGDCKRRNIPFDLTTNYLEHIYKEQKGLCFYTDKPIATEMTRNGANRSHSLSVDRIVPEYGYIQGNVVLCLLRANVVKNDLTLQEIKEWLPGWYARLEQFFVKELFK